MTGSSSSKPNNTPADLALQEDSHPNSSKRHVDGSETFSSTDPICCQATDFTGCFITF